MHQFFNVNRRHFLSHCIFPFILILWELGLCRVGSSIAVFSKEYKFWSLCKIREESKLRDCNILDTVLTYRWTDFDDYIKCVIFSSVTIQNITSTVDFPGSSVGKESACNAGDLGSISGLGRSPGEWTAATHSSILAWKIPWTGEPDGLQTMGLQRVRHNWATFNFKWNIILLHTHVCSQLWSTLCDPMECSPPGSSIREFIPGKNTGVGCHFLLQGIFLTQVLNPFLLYLLHWQIFFYHWATWKSPLLYIPLVNILLFQFLQCNCYWWL